MSTPDVPPESYPLPWATDVDECGRIWSRPDQSIDRFIVDLGDDPDGEDLADYIVTAAHGYPVLLEAVRELLAEYPHPGTIATVRIRERLLAALDKIGVGS